VISGGHRASFDFAQDEEKSDVPSAMYLILSEVEGRTTLMQVFQDLCMP